MLSMKSFCRCSRMKVCKPRNAGSRHAVREDRHVSTGRPARSLVRAFADRAIAFERQAEGIETRMACRAQRGFPGVWPASRAPADRISLRRWAIRARPAAAAEPLRPGHAAPPSYPRFTGLVRKPGEFCVRKTAIGSKPPRPYWLASSTRTHLFEIACHFRHAVMPGERRIDKGVVPVQQVQHRTIVAERIFDKPDRLLKHRLAQIVVETSGNARDRPSCSSQSAGSQASCR